MLALILLQIWAGSWSVGQIAIAIIIIAGICILVYLGLQKLEITPSPFLVKVLTVIAVVAIIVIAIRFLMTL